MTIPAVAPRPQNPSAELAAISENQIAEVASFIAFQSGRTKEAVEAHLRWFLLENPVRDPAEPLGFALRSHGEIVGCILCSPQLFRFGREKILLMGSSSFYVDEAHRGAGGRIFLQYCRLAIKHPLFGTSANAQAAALWKAAGASPIPDSDGELLGVLDWPPLVEEAAHRRNSSRALAKVAATPVSRLAAFFRPLKIDRQSSELLRPLTSAEQAAALLVHAPSEKLTAVRDLAYLCWRYFSRPDDSAEVFAFRSLRLQQDVFVAVNRRTRGYRGQINALNLLDVFPQVPADEYLQIVGALIHRYEEHIHAVVLRGLSPDLRRVFCDLGFQYRAFDASIAWLLDRSALLPSQSWYFVPADGDGLI